MSVKTTQFIDAKCIESIDHGCNMVVDKAGELIVDMLTVSPSLSSIPTASSVLDASNYTVQAISFGKDFSGYDSHAHNVGNTLATQTLFVDNVVRVVSFEDVTVSSYHTSATIGRIINQTPEVSAFYALLPEYPAPNNTRLEERDTSHTLSVAADNHNTGHNVNALMVKEASAGTFVNRGELIGCWPASAGTDFAILSSFTDAGHSIYSGTFSGNFNYFGNMDPSGS